MAGLHNEAVNNLNGGRFLVAFLTLVKFLLPYNGSENIFFVNDIGCVGVDGSSSIPQQRIDYRKKSIRYE